MTDSGYKTSEIGFSLGTRFEQFQNIFLRPEVDFLIEDLETSSKASSTLKKQEGSYTDLYFNYSINQDLRDKKYRSESGYQTFFSQEVPIVSDNSEFSNAFEISKYKKVEYLAQGTLYPDLIESKSVTGSQTSKIKSHHNVGGLPKKMKLKLVEPLRLLFKDEVRKLGLELKLSKQIISRHPFPGPGLAIRMPGQITKEKLRF